jgi:hypothetical protein
MKPIPEYLRKIEKVLLAGNATEHTYRPALQVLVESMAPDIVAANEPKREQYGAPDYVVSRADAPIGYIEAKDIGKPLDVVEREEQLKRYRQDLHNLILTDYLEFRWYVWTFHVGGYQVCQKWLKDRKGRQLTYDDITHYQRICAALGETICLMAEIDHIIDAHGG